MFMFSTPALLNIHTCLFKSITAYCAGVWTEGYEEEAFPHLQRTVDIVGDKSNVFYLYNNNSQVMSRCFSKNVITAFPFQFMLHSGTRNLIRS